jgi:hypothetical protein
MEGYQQKYERMCGELRDEKFEKGNLELYYKQSLNVVEESSKHIKNLTIQLSKLNQVFEQERQKVGRMEDTHQRDQEQLESTVKGWRERSKGWEVKFRERVEYVHPMVFEDVRGRWARAEEEATRLK